MSYAFGGINIDSKKKVLSLRTSTQIILVDKSQSKATYDYNIVVLVDEIYGKIKLQAIQLFLESSGVTRYKIISALNCFISKEEIKQEQKEGLIKFYRDNRNDFTSELEGAVIITCGPALYSLTRSDDIYPVYCQEFIFGMNHFYFEGNWVYPIESFSELFASGFTQGAVDSYKTKIAQFQLQKACEKARQGIAPPRTPRINLIYLSQQEDFERFYDDNKEQKDKIMAIDLETSGFDFMRDRVGCVTISFDGNTGYYIPWQLALDNKERLESIIYQNYWLGANLKFDVKFLWHAGFSQARIDEDLVTLGHTLDETRSNSLKTLAYFYTTHGGYDRALDEYRRKTKIDNYLDIPEEILQDYATMDVIVTWRAFHNILKHMRKLDKKHPNYKHKENTLEHYYRNIRIPANNLYARMEYRGVYVDIELLNHNRQKVIQRIDEITLELSQSFGVPATFDFGSPTALGSLLAQQGWECLGRGKSGGFSTSDEQLVRWASTHPEAKLLQEFRTCRVVLNTFMGDSKGTKGWAQYVRAHGEDNTFRMHPSYNVMGADTGRQKCREPNMQNIPARGPFAKEISECISVPNKNEYYLLTLDYSGLQLRLAALDGEDKILLNLYKKDRAADIHSLTGYGVLVKDKQWDIDIVEVEHNGKHYRFLGGQKVRTKNRGEVFAQELTEEDELL